jgi:hypothetical protein
VDHIVPQASAGSDEPANLALCCKSCNLRKGDHISGADPESREETLLFNPRQDAWNEHFDFDAGRFQLLGTSPTGRATIDQLKMNRSYQIQARKYWWKPAFIPKTCVKYRSGQWWASGRVGSACTRSGSKEPIENKHGPLGMRIGFMLETEPHRRPIHTGENFVFCHLQPLCHCWLNNRSIWQKDHEVKLPECTLCHLCTTGDGITIRSQILCQILFHLSCCFKRHRI